MRLLCTHNCRYTRTYRSSFSFCFADNHLSCCCNRLIDQFRSCLLLRSFKVMSGHVILFLSSGDLTWLSFRCLSSSSTFLSYLWLFFCLHTCTADQKPIDLYVDVYNVHLCVFSFFFCRVGGFLSQSVWFDLLLHLFPTSFVITRFQIGRKFRFIRLILIKNWLFYFGFSIAGQRQSDRCAIWLTQLDLQFNQFDQFDWF